MTANYALLPQVYPSEEGWDNKQQSGWKFVFWLKQLF